jgi:magnesium transporter
VIRAIRYTQGVEVADEVAPDELAASIDPGKALLWVDVVDPAPAALDSIAAQLSLRDHALAHLYRRAERTKLEHLGDHFHVALHDCAVDSTGLVTQEIDILFGDGWLVSVRRPKDETESAPFDVDTVRRRFERERGAAPEIDEGLLVWALLDVIVDRYFRALDEFDDRIDDTEEAVLDADGAPHVPRQVFELRRSLVRFRRTVAPLREVVSELLRREVGFLGSDALVRLQDVYDHVLRIADVIDSQRDLVTGLLEANLAVTSNRMNEVMKRMTSWGAILLGASLIAGIYGMNFTDLPLLESPWGYPAALATMAVLTVSLYVWFRRRQWL